MGAQGDVWPLVGDVALGRPGYTGDPTGPAGVGLRRREGLF